MIKKVVISSLLLLFIPGCGNINSSESEEASSVESTALEQTSQPINVEAPLQSAEFLKVQLNLADSIEKGTIEMYTGIKDSYSIGENVDVILNDNDNIEQINIRNISRTDITSLLEEIDFPLTDSIKEFMVKTDLDDEVIGDSYFTNYKGTGVHLTLKGSLLKKGSAEEDLSLILLYNESRFNDFR